MIPDNGAGYACTGAKRIDDREMADQVPRYACALCRDTRSGLLDISDMTTMFTEVRSGGFRREVELCDRMGEGASGLCDGGGGGSGVLRIAAVLAGDLVLGVGSSAGEYKVRQPQERSCL